MAGYFANVHYNSAYVDEGWSRCSGNGGCVGSVCVGVIIVGSCHVDVVVAGFVVEFVDKRGVHGWDIRRSGGCRQWLVKWGVTSDLGGSGLNRGH